MRDGLSLVTSTKICSVEVTKDGLVKSLAFIGEGGIVVVKYSLLLSSVPADEVANRARKFIGMQAA
jgi:hypothetical protein